MATAKTESKEKEFEQKYLDNVMGQIKKQEKNLKQSIKSAEGEARELNSHFFDDVKLDYDGYSTSMETALSIHQQQQLLSEREHAWQHSAKQLDTVERLEKKPYLHESIFKNKAKKSQKQFILV